MLRVCVVRTLLIYDDGCAAKRHISSNNRCFWLGAQVILRDQAG
jgi:hypothetical protein